MKKRIFWITAVAVTALALSLNAVAQPGGGQGRGQGPGGGGQGPGGGGQVPPGGGFGMGQFPGMGMMMGGGPGGPGGMFGVLQNPELANILELTPAQRESLPGVVRAAIQEEIQRAVQDGGAPPQPGSPPNPAMMQRMDRAMDAVQERIHAELTPAQRTKAGELQFQVQGGFESPFLDARTLGVLELTDAQKAEVRKITEERNAENRAAMEALRDSPEGLRSPEAWERLRTASEARNKRFADQIQALLTPAQKAKADQLTAEIPALRERLGISAPGQQRGQQQRGGQQQPAFVPGEGSWRPGQGAGQGGNAPSPGGQQRGNFPRGN